MLYTELLAPEEARRHLEAALTMAEELRSRLLIHWATGALAAARFVGGDLPGAEACLAAVLAAGTSMDTMFGRFCWARRAELALHLGDPAQALRIVEQLIASAPGMSPGRVITFLWKLKGETLAAMGKTQQACILLQEAVKNAHATGERFLRWHLHASLGRLYRGKGRYPEVEEELAAARELVMELSLTVPEGEMRDRFIRRAHDMVDEAKKL
jgi:tetratricopeptide (TPR) repeat protein